MRLGVAVGVAAGFAMLVAAPAAAFASSKPKPPRALWSQFPLGQARTTTAPVTTTRAGRGADTPRGPAPTAATDGPSRAWVIGVATAALGVIGIGAILGFSSTKRAEGGADVRGFLRYERNDKHGDDPAPEEMTAREGVPVATEDVAAAPGLSDVGEHITSVLAAAEAAAAKLRAEAAQDAKAVVEEAKRRAEGMISRAREESESTRASAQHTLGEAEAASRDLRSDADRYATNRRREADEQATQIVVEAERNAAVVAETAKERHRVVLTNIATSEARLRDLAKSLRGVASALDKVVGDRAASTDQESLEQTLRRRVPATDEEATPDRSALS